MDSKDKVLVLFSGGKDSFLTACRLAHKGNYVVLLSFNGGGVFWEQNFKHGANRLIKRFGPGQIEYAGVYPTVGTIARLNRTWIYKTTKELSELYPNITNCQFQCLHCQTAMWVAAIAYANAKGISKIACGYKDNDVFCTGILGYIDRIKELANNFDIEIELPLWDFGEDYKRDIEMGRYCFIPQVYEPKCVLGNPVKNGFPEAEKEDMLRYFDTEFKDKLVESINDLTRIFRVLKLDDESFPYIEYPDTSGEGGLY